MKYNPYLFVIPLLMFISIFSLKDTVRAGSKVKNTRIVSYNSNQFHWFMPDGLDWTYTGINTIADEIYITGCDGPATGEICEFGYSDYQLNNPSDPTLGVKAIYKNFPDARIYRVVW